MAEFPRGVRLSNPGNIERGEDHWQGMSKLQDDDRFIRFDTPAFGIRAIMVILRNYVRSDGVFPSVSGMISRWAPTNENNTQAYIDDVSSFLQVGADSQLNLDDDNTLIALAQDITIHENGKAPSGYPEAWFSTDTYQDAAEMVLAP